MKYRNLEILTSWNHEIHEILKYCKYWKHWIIEMLKSLQFWKPWNLEILKSLTSWNLEILNILESSTLEHVANSFRRPWLSTILRNVSLRRLAAWNVRRCIARRGERKRERTTENNSEKERELERDLNHKVVACWGGSAGKWKGTGKGPGSECTQMSSPALITAALAAQKAETCLLKRLQGFKVSIFQYFKISKFQNFKISKYQHFKISIILSF